MLVTGIGLVPEATPTVLHMAIVVTGAALLVLTQVKPVWVIVMAALAGVLVHR